MMNATKSRVRGKRSYRKVIRRRTGTTKIGQSLGPPSFTTNMAFVHKFRFYASSATSVNGSAIRFSDLATLFGIATDANTLTCPVESVKLLRVAIYGPCAPLASGPTLMPITVGLQWGTDNYISGNSTTYSDTSVSGAEPPKIVATPPKNTDTIGWHVNTDGSTAFTIYCPVNSIIDVTTLSHLIDDNSACGVSTYTGVLTPNVFFYGRLDGNSNGASAKFKAMGVVNGA